MQRDDQHESALGARRRRRHRRRGAVGLVAATLATAAAILAWQTAMRGPRASDVRDFRIVPYGSSQSLGPARWSAGSPFVLRFTLAQDAYALVFHVDALGTPSLLFPESHAQPFEGGHSVQIPPDGSGQAWLLGDEPGPEWFFLVASRNPSLDPTDVLRRMDAQADGEEPPEAMADALEKLLRAWVGVPRVLRIEVVSRSEVSVARPAGGSSL